MYMAAAALPQIELAGVLAATVKRGSAGTSKLCLAQSGRGGICGRSSSRPSRGFSSYCPEETCHSREATIQRRTVAAALVVAAQFCLVAAALVVAAQFCLVAAAETSLACRSWPCSTVSRLRSYTKFLMTYLRLQ